MSQTHVNTDDCWLYARKIKSNGYPVLVTRYDGKNRYYYVHRIMYENFVGAIPDTLVVDHMCRVRRCINPAHLRLLTISENVLAGEGLAVQHSKKTHCPKGHPYSEENTRIEIRRNRKGRHCKTCLRIWESKHPRIRRTLTSE